MTSCLGCYRPFKNERRQMQAFCTLKFRTVLCSDEAPGILEEDEAVPL